MNSTAGSSPILELTGLVRDLQRPMELEEVLACVVDRAAVVVDTPRTSIRLLDPTRTRLIATARAGSPLHEDPTTEFELGEGLIGWIAEHAKPIRTGDPTSDPRFVQRDGMKAQMGSFLGVPLISGPVCMGVLSAVHPDVDHFTGEHERLLVLLSGICAPYVEIARLSRLSSVDPLTGALNRRWLEQAFPEDATDENGIITPLCMIVVDVDRFKDINDRFGHAVGDEAIKRLAQVLASVLRVGDAVVRHGGDEFILVLPSVNSQVASRVAKRAQDAVEKLELRIGEVRLSLTTSMGIAERRSGESREDVIERADSAMYEAKKAGRNRVRLSG